MTMALLNPKDAARYCTDHGKAIERSTLDTLRHTGGGPPFYKEDGGKNVFYDPNDLDEWIKSNPLTKYNSTSEYPPKLRVKRKAKNGGE
jgi:hypothetical protein